MQLEFYVALIIQLVLQSCGMIPGAVIPTNTNLPATSSSCKLVCGVSTQLIHLRPRLSVLIGGNPLTDISCIPMSLVVMM
jgi:hypothetical protein